MDASTDWVTFVLVVMGIMTLSMLGVTLYVMIRLIGFSTRSPWFMVEKDDRGVVQIAEMAVKAERDAPPLQVTREDPTSTVEMPLNATGIPDFDSEEMDEVGEREAG